MNREAIVKGARMLKILKAGANGLRRLHTSNKVRTCFALGLLIGEIRADFAGRLSIQAPLPESSI